MKLLLRFFGWIFAVGTVEVAALIHARTLGVDVSDLIDPVRESIAKRSP